MTIGSLLSLLALLAVGLAPPGAAHESPFEWRDSGHAVGYCDMTSGGYVRHAQTIVWAAGYLNAMSDVDSVVGPNTNTAIRGYQSYHGLAVDGCVGWNTWNNMQHATHWNNQLAYYDPHFAFQYRNCSNGTCYGDYYEWQERSELRRARYYWFNLYCWYVKKLINDSNGNVMNVDWAVKHTNGDTCIYG